MEVKALSNQHPWPKSSFKVSLRYLQWVFTVLCILFSSQEQAGDVFVCLFVFKLAGMSAHKRTPKFSLHRLARLFIHSLIWMFVFGVLDWSSSCHQQHSMNKKCQRNVSDRLVCMCIYFKWLKSYLKAFSFKDPLTIQWLHSYEHSFKQEFIPYFDVGSVLLFHLNLIPCQVVKLTGWQKRL